MGRPDGNADPGELGHFNALASQWWDEDGDLRTLHRINPLRTQYVIDGAGLDGALCLDIGCGGGILCESLAAHATSVCGIDLATDSLEVARLHLAVSGLDNVEYRQISSSDLARESPGGYDVVTCMEVIEHVPDPAALVKDCARLVKPGGHVFFSTINRTLRAFGLAIVAGEYLTGLIPRGTHTWQQLVKPSELARIARNARLELVDMAGLDYDPVSDTATLSRDISVNYLAHFSRAE